MHPQLGAALDLVDFIAWYNPDFKYIYIEYGCFELERAILTKSPQSVYNDILNYLREKT